VEDKPNEVPQPQPQWIREAETTYANVVSVSGGGFDVALTFGKQDYSRLDESGEPETHAVVKVAMSWGHLKSMVPLLAKVVAGYESRFGEIPAPGFDTLWKE